jgi:hypothetical protein
VNITELRLAADAIESEPRSFGMADWAKIQVEADDPRGACRTACCVAGTVFATRVRSFQRRDFSRHGWLKDDLAARVKRTAGKILELDEEQADRLFSDGSWWGETLRSLGFRKHIEQWGADGWEIMLDQITPRHAVRVLRALADGKVTL